MTTKELKDHFELHIQLENASAALKNLQDAAVPGAQRLTGMPHAPGIRDKVGDLAVEIADLQMWISGAEARMRQSEERVASFIQTIDDSSLRQDFRLRYLRYLTWGDIAEIHQWRISEDGLRKRCDRYVRSLEDGNAL